MKRVALLLALAFPCGATITVSGCLSGFSGTQCAVNAGQTLSITFNKPVNVSVSGNGGLSCTTNCTTTVFTAPTANTVPVLRSVYGCPGHPLDSIFTTPIVNAPVNANSANWIAALAQSTNKVNISQDWSTNLANNSTPTKLINFAYDPSLRTVPFLWPAEPKLREHGAYPQTNGNADHHQVTVNRETCDWYETYEDNGPPSALLASSGNIYNPRGTTIGSVTFGPYDLSPLGSVDAAGLPVQAFLLTANDVRNGGNHPLRFTVATGFNWSGVPATTIYQWPATGGNGSSPTCTTPSGPGTTCPQMGSWFRLTTAWYNANINNYSTLAKNVINQLRNYGMVDADNGPNMNVQGDFDINEDQAVITAIKEVNSSAIPVSAFEAVDVSALCVQGGGANCATHGSDSSRAAAGSGFVTPTMSAVLTISAAAETTLTVPIAIQPVTVGTPYPYFTVQAGQLQAGLQIQSWVNRSANQSVTWSSGDPANVGTITAGGKYTPPATQVTSRVDTVVVTPVANPNTSVMVFITVLPQTADHSIRIDTASGSNHTDASGNVWLADFVSQQYGQFRLNFNFGSDSAWPGLAPANSTTWQTITGTDSDVVYGPFMVDNGNYAITFMNAYGFNGGTWNFITSFVNNHSYNVGPKYFEINGQTEAISDPGVITGWRSRIPSSVVVPALVTNNVLLMAVRAHDVLTGQTQAFLNGLQIVPDASAPKWTIDSQNQTSIKPNAIGYWNCNAFGPTGTAGTLQLTLVDWYTGQNNPVWTVVNGPGTIDQNGCYTAPATQSQTASVTVQAGNGTVTGQATFYVIGSSYPLYWNH